MDLPRESMVREGKNAAVNSKAFPHLKVEYPRRSQQRSGRSGRRMGSAMVTGNCSWREQLCHVLLGVSVSREATIGFDNVEAIDNPNRRNLICTMVIEALSDWVEESVGSEEVEAGSVAILLRSLPIKGS